SVKKRLPAPAPPEAVTVTSGRSGGKSDAKVSAKKTRNDGQSAACSPRIRVSSTGSAVACAQPTVSPSRISAAKSSLSGATVAGVFMLDQLPERPLGRRETAAQVPMFFFVDRGGPDEKPGRLLIPPNGQQGSIR